MIDSPAKPVPAIGPEDAAADHGPVQPPGFTAIAPVAGSYHVRQVVEQAVTPNDFPRRPRLTPRRRSPTTG